MPRRDPAEYESLERLATVPEFCTVVIYEHSPDGVAPDLQAPCGKEIVTMAYKGTGACGEEHYKILTKDHNEKPKTVGINPTGDC